MSEQELDWQIVQRVQQGDKAAFNVLVKKYQHRIANLISRYVSNHGDVADVAQEAFIKAYRAIPGFRGESAFYTWLYRIAVNSAKNYLVLRVEPLQALTNLQVGLVAVHQDGPIVFYCIQALHDQVFEATSCLVE